MKSNMCWRWEGKFIFLSFKLNLFFKNLNSFKTYLKLNCKFRNLCGNQLLAIEFHDLHTSSSYTLGGSNNKYKRAKSALQPDVSIKRRNIASSRKKEKIFLLINSMLCDIHFFACSFLARRFQFLPCFAFFSCAAAFIERVCEIAKKNENYSNRKSLFINLNIFLLRKKMAWK